MDHMLLSKQVESPAYTLVFSKVDLSAVELAAELSLIFPPTHISLSVFSPLLLRALLRGSFKMHFSSIMERTSALY